MTKCLDFPVYVGVKDLIQALGAGTDTISFFWALSSVSVLNST